MRWARPMEFYNPNEDAYDEVIVSDDVPEPTGVQSMDITGPPEPWPAPNAPPHPDHDWGCNPAPQQPGAQANEPHPEQDYDWGPPERPATDGTNAGSWGRQEPQPPANGDKPYGWQYYGHNDITLADADDASLFKDTIICDFCGGEFFAATYYSDHIAGQCVADTAAPVAGIEDQPPLSDSDSDVVVVGVVSPPPSPPANTGPASADLVSEMSEVLADLGCEFIISDTDDSDVEE